MPELADQGVTVFQWSESDRTTIAEATEAHAADVWKKEVAPAVGGDAADQVWSAYTEALDTHEGESDYVDGLAGCSK